MGATMGMESLEIAMMSDGMDVFERMEGLHGLAMEMCDCLARHADAGIAREFSGLSEESIGRLGSTEMAVAVYVNLKDQIDGFAAARACDLNLASVSAHRARAMFDGSVKAGEDLGRTVDAAVALGKGSVSISCLLDAFGIESDDGATISVEDAGRVAAVLKGDA